VPVRAQKLDREGRAWLDRNSASAEVNVSGVWSTESFGTVTLEQAQGRREINGDGDGWRVDGVVSGRSVFLLFSGANRGIEYSAELTAERETLLTGSYSDGLKDKPGGKPMSMTRTSKPVVGPAVGGEKETARVIVYRKSRSSAEPSVYLDGRQLVWMKNSSYFSFRVSPDAHVLSSHPDEKPVTINAVAGSTYYIKCSLVGAWVKIFGRVELVEEAEANRTLKQLTPLPASYVVADSIVSLDQIAIK
jgi:hypothetical protein